jgi:hypothetical protein
MYLLHANPEKSKKKEHSLIQPKPPPWATVGSTCTLNSVFQPKNYHRERLWAAPEVQPLTTTTVGDRWQHL